MPRARGTEGGRRRIDKHARRRREKTKRKCQGKGDCGFAFVIRGVVKKAGAKVSGKDVPQIVIVIDSISDG